MDGEANEPPFGRPGLFLVALDHVVGAAEVVGGGAVADRPASRPVRMILDRELLRFSA